jgi:uncharacterized membrane protein
MVLVGIAAGVATGLTAGWSYAPLCGWDVAALLFVTSVWLAVGSMNPVRTAAHATRENPGRTASDLIVVCAAVASLAAIGVVLGKANAEKGTAQDLLAALAVASVVLSWFTVHTLYALRYAELYYNGHPGGVDFNQEPLPPRYADFAYLAFTIGMTFQVSDTDVRTPRIRAVALRHAMLSYLFGAVILASMINLIVGLGSGSG